LGTELIVDANDACSPDVSTRIVEVRAEQPTAPRDLGFTDDAFCLRAVTTSDSPRRYLVTLESVDPSGNVARSTLPIDVPSSPHDCVDPSSAPIAAEDDPRCGLPPPTAGCTCRLAGAGSSSAFGASLPLLMLGVVLWRRRR